MSFDSAIPVNRIAYGRGVDFDLGKRSGHGDGGKGKEPSQRQSVNISEETLLRVARAKLGRMVDMRSGYDRRGAISPEPSVGSMFSEKA